MIRRAAERFTALLQPLQNGEDMLIESFRVYAVEGLEELSGLGLSLKGKALGLDLRGHPLEPQEPADIGLVPAVEVHGEGVDLIVLRRPGAPAIRVCPPSSPAPCPWECGRRSGRSAPDPRRRSARIPPWSSGSPSPRPSRRDSRPAISHMAV